MANASDSSHSPDRRQIQFAELESWLDDHRVTEIECLVPDLTGVARGKILPREKFTEDRGMRLPEVVVAMSVTARNIRARGLISMASAAMTPTCTWSPTELYAEIKDLEHEEFMRVISPWEREHLLLHV